MRENSVIWPHITQFFRNKWGKLRNNCENFCVGTNDGKVGMAKNALAARRRNPDVESVAKMLEIVSLLDQQYGVSMIDICW